MGSIGYCHKNSLVNRPRRKLRHTSSPEKMHLVCGCPGCKLQRIKLGRSLKKLSEELAKAEYSYDCNATSISSSLHGHIMAGSA